MADCCTDRTKSGISNKREEKLEKEEIERLFNNNTKMALEEDEDKFNKTLPRSGLSKSTAQRLKIEFRFIRHVMRILNNDVDGGPKDERVSQANDLVKEYYSN